MKTEELLVQLLTEFTKLPDQDQKIFRHAFNLGLTNFDDFIECIDIKKFTPEGNQWLKQFEQSKLFTEFDQKLIQSPVKNYSTSKGSIGYNFFGWLLFLTGAGLTIFGVMYEPSVKSYEIGDRVVNLGLIANKNSYTVAGGSLLIAGAIFACKS